MKDIIVSGVNIQWPWSELLLQGEKLVETRSYPLPRKYEDVWLALIETPGKKSGKNPNYMRRARIAGLITFSKSFRYGSEAEWEADFPRHRVPSGHPIFGFKADQPKWGWTVAEVIAFKDAHPVPSKRGIVFASKCVLTGEHALLLQKD